MTNPDGSLPRIDFVADGEQCPTCGGEELRILKTKTRTVVSLANGPFEAREILKKCARGTRCPPMRSQTLRRLVRPRQKFAFDIVVHVGLARYLRRMQREEICAELYEQRDIKICESSVSIMCDRFLLLLEALHLDRAPQLQAAMGAYPLHLDATCERGRGGTFVCINGWRDWVLLSARIPSENGDYLRPVVDEVVTLFGEPVATIRDLGGAMAEAVEATRQRGIPDLVCHYHFLGRVGEKLFAQPYSLLRTILKSSAVQGGLRALLRDLRPYRQSVIHDGRFGAGRVREDLLALVQWVLEGDGKKTLRYPFGLKHVDFVRRCRNALNAAERWVARPRTGPERRAIGHIQSLVTRLDRDKRIADALGELDKRWPAFCELRAVLRLSNAELPTGDGRDRQMELPALEVQRLHEIEEAVKDYRGELLQRTADLPKRNLKSSPHGIILKYLNRYGDHLFGHPALRDDDDSVIAVVERTNNRAEHKFGDEKRLLRRRVGKAHLARDLEEQPAQAALALNLRCSDYVQVLCGSLDNLPAAFTNLDDDAIARAKPLVRDHRDSALQRRVRAILEQDVDLPSQQMPATAAASPAESNPTVV